MFIVPIPNLWDSEFRELFERLIRVLRSMNGDFELLNLLIDKWFGYFTF